MKQLFDGVFEENGNLYTKNLVPGKKVYGEKLVQSNGTEYREWIPFRSKLCAGIKNRLKEFPVKNNSRVLYLGCAEGTTCSHLSDIAGEKGMIFGIDISEKAMQKFVLLSEERQNLIPFVGNASNPAEYSEFMKELMPEVLVQDVSQKNQTEIFLKNAELFLKKNSIALLCLKSRSIDSAANPKTILEKELRKIEPVLLVQQIIDLKPFEKDHFLLCCKKKIN